MPSPNAIRGSESPLLARESSEASGYGSSQEVKLQVLAEKVYALLKEELMLEYERRGWNRSR